MSFNQNKTLEKPPAICKNFRRTFCVFIIIIIGGSSSTYFLNYLLTYSLTYLLTATEFLPGGSSPCTSTYKTIENKIYINETIK
jgi:hypothetical protein